MWAMSVYAAVLFYLLTPGVLVSLPPGASHTTTNLTHAAVFGLVWMLTHKMVWKLVSK
jgi:quercetin dioxygenase-like cupin family protein